MTAAAAAVEVEVAKEVSVEMETGNAPIQVAAILISPGGSSAIDVEKINRMVREGVETVVDQEEEEEVSATLGFCIQC